MENIEEKKSTKWRKLTVKRLLCILALAFQKR